MKTPIRILGIIPARGGSQGLPGKNVRPLLGKSLIQRAFECGVAAGIFDRLILSTNDPEAERIAQEIGLEVPFRRPAELANSTASAIDVVLHALGFLRTQNYQPDAVLWLQPTSPLRTPAHLRRAVELLEHCDSVCSVVPVPKTLCPHYVMKITDGGFLDFFLDEAKHLVRRQDVPPAYAREGTVYLTRTETILSKKSFYGERCCPLILEEHESLSIDVLEDWQRAERILEGTEPRLAA